MPPVFEMRIPAKINLTFFFLSQKCLFSSSKYAHIRARFCRIVVDSTPYVWNSNHIDWTWISYDILALLFGRPFFHFSLSHLHFIIFSILIDAHVKICWSYYSHFNRKCALNVYYKWNFKWIHIPVIIVAIATKMYPMFCCILKIS